MFDNINHNFSIDDLESQYKNRQSPNLEQIRIGLEEKHNKIQELKAREKEKESNILNEQFTLFKMLGFEEGTDLTETRQFPTFKKAMEKSVHTQLLMFLITASNFEKGDKEFNYISRGKAKEMATTIIGDMNNRKFDRIMKKMLEEHKDLVKLQKRLGGKDFYRIRVTDKEGKNFVTGNRLMCRNLARRHGEIGCRAYLTLLWRCYNPSINSHQETKITLNNLAKACGYSDTDGKNSIKFKTALTDLATDGYIRFKKVPYRDYENPYIREIHCFEIIQFEEWFNSIDLIIKQL